ncbi:hypothetical protein SMICM304S_06942 [Streptomyces microflavus]
MAERSWGGTKLADRRAARRQTLLDTAERLAGEEGCAAVTVRSVCRQARLTDRYFYESFVGRDDLLLAAFERVADEARSALEKAVALSDPQLEVRARAAVSAFVALVLDAPHKGRLLLLEPFADPVLGAHSHRLMPVFTDLVGGQLSGTGTTSTAGWPRTPWSAAWRASSRGGCTARSTCHANGWKHTVCTWCSRRRRHGPSTPPVKDRSPAFSTGIPLTTVGDP